MKNSFHLTPLQKKANAWLCVLVTCGLFAVAGILSSTASDLDTASVMITVALGVTVGVLVRTCTKRGWTYAEQASGRPLSFTWSGRRRIGVVWRAVGLILVGHAVINVLDGMAWSDTSQALLMAIALILITGSAIATGLFYGWKEATTPGVENSQSA